MRVFVAALTTLTGSQISSGFGSFLGDGVSSFLFMAIVTFHPNMFSGEGPTGFLMVECSLIQPHQVMFFTLVFVVTGFTALGETTMESSFFLNSNLNFTMTRHASLASVS